MIKEMVRKLIDEGQKSIDWYKGQIDECLSSKYYTTEYKIKLKREYQDKINEALTTYRNAINDLFISEINRINDINLYKDNNPEETANILKMIELSKSNISEYELQDLANKYKDNNIIIRVLSGIANEKDYNLFIDNPSTVKKIESDEIERQREMLMSQLEVEAHNLTSLRIELALKSLTV